jgi:hypothetical protein
MRFCAEIVARLTSRHLHRRAPAHRLGSRVTPGASLWLATTEKSDRLTSFVGDRGRQRRCIYVPVRLGDGKGWLMPPRTHRASPGQPRGRAEFIGADLLGRHNTSSGSVSRATGSRRSEKT